MTIRESFRVNSVLEQIYGKSCPRNPYTSAFDTLLSNWDKIAKESDIPYSLTYGSYLGWLRHKDYIPYDEDLDVHIGPESVSKLMSLRGKDSCCNASELGKYKLNGDVPRLILNPHHDKRVDNEYRPRYDCSGNATKVYSDNCAFNGPVARLLYPGREQYLHIDIFVYHREDNEQKKREIKDSGYASEFYGPYGSYVASSSGSSLPPTEPCSLHGIGTSCFQDGRHLMTSIYGKDFLQPIKIWDENNKKWINK